MLSKPKRGMDAAQLSFDCDIVSHLKAFFFRKFSLRTLYGRNSGVPPLLHIASPKALHGVPAHYNEVL